MDVVKSMDEIRINMKTMDNYLVKADDPEYTYALGLISKGICFVADASTGEFRFYPSRFIGYANNTMSKHECNSSKDGRVTNPAISKVLNQKPEADSEMEIAYKEYCKSLGIQVKEKGSFGVSRKYWKFSY